MNFSTHSWLFLQFLVEIKIDVHSKYVKGRLQFTVVLILQWNTKIQTTGKNIKL